MFFGYIFEGVTEGIYGRKEMRRENLDQNWELADGLYNVYAMMNPAREKKIVNLPHDYMIEGDVDAYAVEKTASGFYKAGVKNYTKYLNLPEEWQGEQIYLQLDGAMMNASLEVNGCKVGMIHYGYAPYCVNITDALYFGQQNRITITTHPGTQPNSRWYSGAGLYRSIHLLHGPSVHIANDGIYAYTNNIGWGEKGYAETAIIKAQVEVENHNTIAHTAVVEVYLTAENDSEIVITRSCKLQIEANASATAYVTMTLNDPKLWDIDHPELYELHAKVRDCGSFKTREIPSEMECADEASVLFGIRMVTADVRKGLQINGKTVKLKGGCLHHDNGLLGAVSLYDVEYRKLSRLKSLGFNAIRTTHNPPSKALLDACDHIGMYVFDEAFDAWTIAKEAGDYNLFFETDWKKDLRAFMQRDRSRACVILWSTGNEIPERGGLNHGYSRATEIAAYARSLDATRPISNAICSYWSGLDDVLQMENLKKMAEKVRNFGAMQNADADGEDDLFWEDNSWAFTNGLDIVGYNYMEDKYERDHELYPERIMLGSENYPKEIGIRWPMVERLPYVLGDFTWTAFDYIGEAGIGRAEYMSEDDPRLKMGQYALTSQGAEFPWRTANDADFDINGELLPQGAYRSVVWGSDKTYLYSYDPSTYGKREILSSWGFPAVSKNWNFDVREGQMVEVLVFSQAEEVELVCNGQAVARKRVDGVTRSQEMPNAVLFELPYHPGILTAISYKDGQKVSEDYLESVGKAEGIQLTLESPETGMPADGHAVSYVRVEVVDGDGRLVPDAEVCLTARLDSHDTEETSAWLAGFGSGNPKTDENYTKGCFTTYKGKAMAVIRAGYVAGQATLRIGGDFSAEIQVQIG